MHIMAKKSPNMTRYYKPVAFKKDGESKKGQRESMHIKIVTKRLKIKNNEKSWKKSEYDDAYLQENMFGMRVNFL